MPAQIISLAQVKHDRRVAAELAKRADAAAERLANEKADLARHLGDSVGAQILADLAVDVLEEQRQAERHRNPNLLPAYSDPANESRGAKHDATKGLDVAEIAKRMRADIKALELAPGFKVSVKIQRYSGGQAIDVKLVAAPAGFRLLSDRAASWIKQFPDQRHRMPLSAEEARSPEWHKLRGQLVEIHASYNRDNSDSMVDYFDVRYYGSADICWQLRRGLEEAQLAEVRGDYWAEPY